MRNTSATLARSQVSDHATRVTATFGFLLPAFFILIFLKVALTGVVDYPGMGIASRIFDLVFVIALLAYLAINAGYYFTNMPHLFISLYFVAAAFLATELFSNQNLLYALFESIKVLTPFIAYLVLRKLASDRPKGFLVLGSLLVGAFFILAIAGLFFKPDTINRGASYAPAYFGGVHTAAYVIGLSGICAYLLYTRGVLALRLALFLVLTASIFLIIAWNVRTATTMFVAFFLVAFWSDIRRIFAPSAFVVTTMTVFAVLGYFLWEGGDGQLAERVQHFSSGRTSMWAYKLELLADASLRELFFGKGLGSDLVISDVWWWAKKDSHNDILHLITETGLMGLSAVAAMILAQRLSVPRKQILVTALFVAYLCASLLSNGLLFRPVPSLLFAVALATVALPGRQMRPH